MGAVSRRGSASSRATIERSRLCLPIDLEGKARFIELSLLTLAAFALRFVILSHPLRYDESYSFLRYGSHSFWVAIHTYNAPNNHIFHSVCMWLSTTLLGAGVAQLRLPAFLLGVALVPLTYRLARHVCGHVGALVSATLVAGCDLLATYSADARGYGMQAALFVGALAFVPDLAREPKMWRALAFAGVLALSLFTVPSLVYGVPVPFVWGAWLARAQGAGLIRRLSWLGAAGVLAGLLTLLLYTPALLYLRDSAFSWGYPLVPVTLPTLFGQLFDYFVASVQHALGLALVFCVVGGLVLDVRERQLPLAAIWIGVPMVVLALHMAIAARPPFARSFVFLVPLVFVLCGRAIDGALAKTALGFRSNAERFAPAMAASLFLWMAGGPYGRYRNALEQTGMNSNYLFEQLVAPLHVGDEFSANMNVLLPIQAYAQIAGKQLRPLRAVWMMGAVQFVGPSGKHVRSLKAPGQRFLLLAMTPSDTDRIPDRVKAELSAGRYRWVETRRFRAYDGHYARLWEIARPALQRPRARRAKR